MNHAFRRTAVICLAVPAITLLGASAALADCQSTSTSSPSAGATPNPFPSLPDKGTGGTCSIHGDSHSHSHGDSHSNGNGNGNGNGMNNMPGMDGMDGMDMPGLSHSHGSSTQGPTTDADHPRTAVLSAFGVVNLGVMASAAVVRRRSRNAKKGATR